MPIILIPSISLGGAGKTIVSEGAGNGMNGDEEEDVAA